MEESKRATDSSVVFDEAIVVYYTHAIAEVAE